MPYYQVPQSPKGQEPLSRPEKFFAGLIVFALVLLAGSLVAWAIAAIWGQILG